MDFGAGLLSQFFDILVEFCDPRFQLLFSSISFFECLNTLWNETEELGSRKNRMNDETDSHFHSASDAILSNDLVWVWGFVNHRHCRRHRCVCGPRQ